MTTEPNVSVAEEWRYDAAKDDPLTALRVPVVTSIYPNWFYLVSLCVGEGEYALWRGLRPNDDEVKLLQSELAYELDWYNASYVARMAERPFDIDGGFNSLTFIKRDEGDWAYRRRTWSIGPALRPSLYDGEAKLDLVGVLDLVHSHGSKDYMPTRWLDWKAARPELFGGAR